MKFEHLFVLVATALMAVACQSKEEQWENPDVCGFINEKHCIKVNYELKYDIIPRPAMDLYTASKSGVGVEMEIFNYGGMLRINKYGIENIYSSKFAPISHFYVVSSEDILITNTFSDNTYGEWAKGRVAVPGFNRLFEDAFISPLAYNYMQEAQEGDSDCLVLVRLISLSNNSEFCGIFHGDYLTEWIINSNYQHIETHSDMTFRSNGCEGFWKALLTAEEQKVYENYLRMSQMGLFSESYELPRTIVEKIVR